MADKNKAAPNTTPAQRAFDSLPKEAQQQVNTVLLHEVEGQIEHLRDAGICETSTAPIGKMEKARDQLLNKDYLNERRQAIIDRNKYQKQAIDPRVKDGLQSGDIDIHKLPKRKDAETKLSMC